MTNLQASFSSSNGISLISKGISLFSSDGISLISSSNGISLISSFVDSSPKFSLVFSPVPSSNMLSGLKATVVPVSSFSFALDALEVGQQPEPRGQLELITWVKTFFLIQNLSIRLLTMRRSPRSFYKSRFYRLMWCTWSEHSIDLLLHSRWRDRKRNWMQRMDNLQLIHRSAGEQVSLRVSDGDSIWQSVSIPERLC